MKPIVAIVGRPNVGKSTLFNRITRTKRAIVDNLAGVTRDRLFSDAKWDDIEFTLVDTGGFEVANDDRFAGQIRTQVRQAIHDADAVIFVLDGKEGISPFDKDLAGILRPVQKPVFYVINKIDGAEQEDFLFEFYVLGFDKAYPVSGEHGYGISDFLDDLVSELPATEIGPESDMIKVAVVGKPNAGKSSLINRVMGQDRLVVSEVPGTTRDAVDSICQFNGKNYLMIDTAGIRRKGRVQKKLEKFSIIKALRSLDRCDIALIVIDADQGVTDQDINVAGYALDRGCACILLLNKWDLVKKRSGTVKEFMEEIKYTAKFLSYAPVLNISATTGFRVPKIFSLVDNVYEQYATRVGTGKLNRILNKAIERNEPSMHRGKRLKFYYGSQVSSKPPTFTVFVNYPDAVHFSYKRYLVNQIRASVELENTPLRLYFRQRTGRIDFASRKGKDRQRKTGKTKQRPKKKKG